MMWESCDGKVKSCNSERGHVIEEVGGGHVMVGGGHMARRSHDGGWRSYGEVVT